MMAEYEQKEHGNGAIAFIPLALVVIPLFFGVNVLYTLLMDGSPSLSFTGIRSIIRSRSLTVASVTLWGLL